MMKQVFSSFLLVALSANAFAQQDAWSEFRGGQRVTYSTTGAEKAKNLEISFDYPISWDGEEGRRPNTLYQVTSEGGKGLEYCSLIIRALPLPSNYTPSKAEVEKLFEPAVLSDFVPAEAKFISGARTELDGQPGAWIHFSQDMNRAGISIKMQAVIFPIYYDKKMIVFGCSVGAGGDAPLKYVQDRYRAFFPLFQQMANSLIIHSKWKSAP